MKIKFYGVRGSYPVPGKDTVKYGGNTACVTFTTVSRDGLINRLIIDSGTGIIRLGRDIFTNYLAKKENPHIPILFTHHHPDHTQGFSFFGPNFSKDFYLPLYGMKTLEKTIENVLSEAMTPPNYPIEYSNLKSNREHNTVTDGQILQLGPFVVKVMQANAPSHPQQGAVYYRIFDKDTNKSVACIWDNESKIGGDKAVINFSRGADIMIHDTQYTAEEYDSDKMIVQGFGHSTYDMAVDDARQANVPLLYCMHFNPTHTDEKLDDIQKIFNPPYKGDIGDYEGDVEDIKVILAKEGMEFEV